MERERMSYHGSVIKAYDRIKKDNMSNVWDRYEAQGLGKDPDQRCPLLYGRHKVRPVFQWALSGRCRQG
jgi:carbon-monoxide dehydrogenase catalytic subunit